MRWRVIARTDLDGKLKRDASDPYAQRSELSRAAFASRVAGGAPGYREDDMKCHLIAVSSYCVRLDW